MRRLRRDYASILIAIDRDGPAVGGTEAKRRIIHASKHSSRFTRGQDTQKLTRSARSDEPVDSTSAHNEPRPSPVALIASQARGQRSRSPATASVQWRRPRSRG